jgi:hypothetical protein
VVNDAERPASRIDDGFDLPTWFVDNWSRVALPAAVVILLSLPILRVEGNQALVLLYALLPLYMMHQYEEHAHGRFVTDFNATIGRGYEVLTRVSAFWMNILLVWVLFLVTFTVTRYWTTAFVFVPIYATLLNSLVHIATALIRRRANPGLYTAVTIMLPWSIVCLVLFTRASALPGRDHLIGLLGGLLGHVFIVGFAVSRRRRLSALAVRSAC